ncbi:MAG: hypothetical protein JWN08_2017 [Frankiales bacterium]|nr:hypothetical protein [Frankiales bacterium]
MDETRPLVTVHDASGADVPFDVLGDDPEAPRRPWGVALLLVVLLLAGAATWVAGRAAHLAEQRRFDSVVDLTLTDRFYFREALGPRVSSRASLMTIDLEVRNDGPRAVELARAVVGDFRFLGRIELGPGEAAVLQLLRTVTCPPDGAEPPLDPAAEGLRLRVVTGAGERTALVSPGRLALDRLRTAARRACGYLPIEEAVDLTADAWAPHDARVPLTLVLTNTSARPLQVLEVRLAPGLRRFGYADVQIELPRRPPGGEPTTSRVDLWVTPDCRDAPHDRDGALLPLPHDPLRVVVGDATASHVGPLRPALGDLTRLFEAYRSACS